MLINELIQSYCMPHRLHAMLHVVHRAARASRVEGRPGNVGRHRPALGRPAARNPGTRAEMSTPNGRVPHSFRGEVGLPGAYTIRSVYSVPHYTLHTRPSAMPPQPLCAQAHFRGITGPPRHNTQFGMRTARQFRLSSKNNPKSQK